MVLPHPRLADPDRAEGAPHTAFVLTGGGSMGAVQAGMVVALHDRGIIPDVLVGTSVGAVNAAHLAGPGGFADRVAELLELWRQLRRTDVFVMDPRRWLRAAAGTRSSVFPGEPLLRLLAAHLGYSDIEEAQRRLAVTATDLVTGTPLVLDHGPVADAVAASAAVPGLLPPVLRGGRTLVDGAISHPGTLAYADHSGVDDIYLLPAGHPCAGPPPRGALGVGLTALALLLHHQLIDEVQRYAGRARLHVVPPLCPLAVSPADFGHTAELIERATAATALWLDDEDRATRHTSSSVLAVHAPHAADPDPARTSHREAKHGVAS